MFSLLRWHRNDEATQEISLGDLDIVKLSLISWAKRKELGLSKWTLAVTATLSLLVVVIQASILVWLAMDISDIMFCSDVTRHVGPVENFTSFFNNEGHDTHYMYKDLWDNNYTR